MSESVTIILPLPDPCLSPNKPVWSHGGRMKRWRITKENRKLACGAVKDAEIETGPWKKAEAQATFFHRQRRRRDGKHFNGMLKGYIDGVIDAGLVVDDDAKHWATLPPLFEIDKENPRVELTITRKDGE